MVSRLNTLLDNYREIIGTATYKVKRLERDQKEYMANKKDYQVLKRRARDKYLDEKGKRDEAELKREDKGRSKLSRDLLQIYLQTAKIYSS